MTSFQQMVQFVSAPRGHIVQFSLPKGKGLTIEFLTASFTLSGSFVAPSVFVHCTLSGSTVAHSLALNQHDPNNWGLAQLVKLYADPGSQVGVQVSSVDGGVFSGRVTLVGQLT